MSVIFKKTSEFERIRTKIEDHLYYSVLAIQGDQSAALKSVEQFTIAFDRFLSTIKAMYQNPSTNEKLGEKSFPIHKGRFRIYYHIKIVNVSDFQITLIDIDDNRQSNLDRFPNHLITFDDDN